MALLMPHDGLLLGNVLCSSICLFCLTIDAGKVDEKATQLHAIASLKVLLDATKPQRGAATSTAASNVRMNFKETTLVAERPNGIIDTTLETVSLRAQPNSAAATLGDFFEPFFLCFSTLCRCRPQSNDLEEPSEPLNMSWPNEGRKRLTYILVAPILVPLWLTLPDTRTPRGKRFFVITFAGSILWIAAYSYLMVWWANVFGETADIPPEVSVASDFLAP